MANKVNVVVVGAGAAGMAAARTLTKAGLSVRVLEARDRVAGRTMAGRLSNGVHVDKGGQWVGPTQDAVLGLIAELGLETYLQYDEGDELTVYDGNVVRYRDDSFGLPEKSASEARRVFTAIDSLAATINQAEPWKTDGATDLDHQTFDSWLTATTSDTLAQRYWRWFAAVFYAAESTEFSLLHALYHVKCGTNLQTMMSNIGGGQEAKVVGGTHQISERIAEELGDAVQLGAVVRTITQDDEGVRVDFEGGSVTADHVIVAMPPTLAGRIRYVPPLPSTRDHLTQQIPEGSVIKMHIAYETPFWREEGLTGSVVSLDDEIGFTLDGCPPDTSCGVLVGFAAGAQARAMRALAADERRKLIIDTMTKWFGPRAAKPFDIGEKDWNEEEFSRGCYGGHLGGGVWTQFGQALKAPVGRIHWAGTETADAWNGYIDGAIRSGYRAAAEVLA